MPDLWEKMTGLWYNFLGLSLKLNPGKTENRAKTGGIFGLWG
jgi:hypothetical protein